MTHRILTSAVIVALATALAACGNDAPADNDGTSCPAGTTYNPVLGECVAFVHANNSNSEPTPDMGSAPEDLGESVDDVAIAPDMPAVPDLSCQTDNDGDGAIALECGGDDCDDTDPRRKPAGAEICDEVDNDCDGELNEDLNCSILAHSDTRLYRVDFFAGTYQDLGPTIADLWDIDTHPDGTTYGIAGNKLYRYDEAAGTWTAAPGTLTFLEDPNGFCIDNEGNAFLTGGGTLRSVDLVQGTTTTIGSMAPAVSSGDCVVNKGNQLFMTSSNTTPDSFARINGDTGAATIVGQTGYDSIWGLTAAYNRVFGLTGAGDVVEINVATGATTVVAQFPEISFYGAASTPGR